MSRIVLFHHVLGLTEGVHRFGRELATAGHHVWTPDLFDGHVFDSIEAGMEYADDLGIAEMMDRAYDAVEELPAEGLIYAGFSYGVLPAQVLLQTREGAGGALLMSGFVDPEEIAGEWERHVPVRLYGTDGDPFLVGDGDIEAAEAIKKHGEHRDDLEIRLYPGDGHLFAEPASPDYDPELAKRLLEDVLADLDQWPPSGASA